MNTHASITRPALRWFGGKFRIADWIIANLPHHETYVEPFGGAASVLLRKVPSAVEVYNDLDGEVVHFFRILRECPEELVRAINLTPFSRSEHALANKPAEDPIERARRFYVLCWQSFASGRRPAGYVQGWRTTKVADTSMVQVWRMTDHLYAVADRLLNVLIESNDAAKVMRQYDQPRTLFYVDPPYLSDLRAHGRDEYQVELKDEAGHRALAETLKTLRGKVVLPFFEKIRTLLFQKS